MTPIPLSRQIKVIEREIEIRQDVLPRKVARGGMTQQQADHGIATMQAVLESLRRLHRLTE